jgi:hypothetical protein
MPLLIAIIVVSAVAGLLARPAVAYGITAVIAVLANLAVVWAFADGKGNDPWWLVGLGIVGALLAVAACRGGQSIRRSRQAGRASTAA